MATEEEYRKSINSYMDSVLMLVAAIHELSWDASNRCKKADLKHSHGAKHPLGPKEHVTPDLSLQVGTDCLYVGDVKIGFGSDDVARQKIASQLLKYDRAITEYQKTQKKPIQNVTNILLTHQTRGVPAADYFSAQAAAKVFTPAHHFAIVGAGRTTQAAGESMFLQRTYGNIQPKEKDEKFRLGVTLKLDHLVASYGSIKFYDAEPPLPYLLATIWDQVLSHFIPEDAYDDPAVDRIATVEVVKVTQILTGFSLRQMDKQLPGAPKADLVRKALQLLVKWKLATQTTKKDQFEVHHRRLRNGSLVYFTKKLATKPKAPKKAASATGDAQLKLF